MRNVIQKGVCVFVICLQVLFPSLWGIEMCTCRPIIKDLNQEELQELTNRKGTHFTMMSLDKLGSDIQIQGKWGAWEDLGGVLPVYPCYVWLSPMSDEEMACYSGFTTARGGVITHWIIPKFTHLAYPSAETVPDYYLD